jgi:hypothetical protein
MAGETPYPLPTRVYLHNWDAPTVTDGLIHGFSLSPFPFHFNVSYHRECKASYGKQSADLAGV